MSFREWQPQYAAHGIATFPVAIGPDGKKPLVSNYSRFGLRASTEITEKFPDATGIGFMVGQRSHLTILDVDSTDDHLLADVLDRHGATPLIVRSGSGNFQAWYRHNGERRLIRPDPDKPIDILGSGFVVAPPSHGKDRKYEFVEGGLNDLDHLPVLHGMPASIARQIATAAPRDTERIREGVRNRKLWESCMKAAHHCDNFDALLDLAHTRNADFVPPLPDKEVVKVATSAWGYTARGENRFGRPGVFFDADTADHFIRTDQDAFILLAFLRAHNKPDSTFMVANGLANTLCWTIKRLARARQRLLRSYIEPVRPASSKNGPALYCWNV